MLEDRLFPNGKPSEPHAIDRAFDQYKLAVDMWDRVRARRQLSNSFYLSINSAIVGAAALSPLQFSSQGLAFVGIIICVLWIASILNYRSLTDDKKRVITKLETLFPTAPFSAESMDSAKRNFRLRFIIRASPLEQIKNTLASL
jgi:hypothetical protein